jgi:Zn-finger domain-containing protein
LFNNSFLRFTTQHTFLGTGTYFAVPILHVVARYGPELMKPSVQIDDVCQEDLLRAEYYALSPAKNDREILPERAL